MSDRADTGTAHPVSRAVFPPPAHTLGPARLSRATGCLVPDREERRGTLQPPPGAHLLQGAFAGPSTRWPGSFYRSSGTWGRPGQGPQAGGPLDAGAGDFSFEVAFPASVYPIGARHYPQISII